MSKSISPLSKRLFLSPPHMSGNEMDLIQDVFSSNYIAPLGPMVDLFEQEICSYTGYPHAVVLNSGTAALHLALVALDMKPGSVVWASTLTFIASVSPITFCQGIPVFFDASPADWNIDCDLLEEELLKSSKNNTLPFALVVTDLYGQTCDYDRLIHLCQHYGVALLSDGAESIGASYKNTKNTPPLTAYSFNGNKIITSGGGGALVSHNKKIIDYARFFSQQAREPFPYYQHEVIGNNYRMSNVLAAIGVSQLRILDQRVERKKSIYNTYKTGFESIKEISMMPMAADRHSNFWLSVMRIDPKLGISPEEIRVFLETLNIESRPVWKPMHRQPVFSNTSYRGGTISDDLFASGLCLPSGTSMTDKEQQLVISYITEYIQKRS